MVFLVVFVLSTTYQLVFYPIIPFSEYIWFFTHKRYNTNLLLISISIFLQIKKNMEEILLTYLDSQYFAMQNRDFVTSFAGKFLCLELDFPRLNQCSQSFFASRWSGVLWVDVGRLCAYQSYKTLVIFCLEAKYVRNPVSAWRCNNVVDV